jgi:hypothetical protein
MEAQREQGRPRRLRPPSLAQHLRLRRAPPPALPWRMGICREVKAAAN